MGISISTVKYTKNSGPEKYFYISLAPGLVKFNPLAQPNFLLQHNCGGIDEEHQNVNLCIIDVLQPLDAHGMPKRASYLQG